MQLTHRPLQSGGSPAVALAPQGDVLALSCSLPLGQTRQTQATKLRLVNAGQLKAAQPPVAAAPSPAEALASSCSAQLIQLCLNTA